MAQGVKTREKTVQIDKPKKVKGLYLNNGTWWLSRQRKGKRVFVSLETKVFSEAVVRAEQMAETPELNPGGLLEAEIERYLKAKVNAGLMTRQTQQNTAQMLRRLVSHFGNITPGSVITAKAQGYYDSLKSSGMSETTAQTYIARTRPFFEWLFKEEKAIRQNPFSGIKMGRLITSARKEFCEIELRNSLIANCHREDLRFILYCGFHAGLRRNEIVEARPCWFDLRRGLLTVRKISPKEADEKGLDAFDLKDREERTVPISKAFLGFLVKWQKGIKQEDGTTSRMDSGQDYCLAPKARVGRSRYRYDFRRFFDDYMEEQGCPWVTAHTMRRTFASLHASAGTPLYHIAKWLGDDIGTTQKHYAHLAPDNGVFERGIG